MNNRIKRPLLGVGVMVLKDFKVLLGKRIGAHGENTWSFPGGHLEFGESLFDCARREVFEETGLLLKNLSKGPYSEDLFEEEELHYITIYVTSQYSSGSLQVKEPDKCLEWQWFEIDNLPDNLFLPLKNLLKEYKSLKKIKP